MLKKYKKILGVLAVLCVLTPVVVLAAPYIWTPGQSLIPCGFGSPDECNFYSFIQLINNVITFLIYLSIPIAAISFAYAGILYLTSAGNTAQMSKAKGIFGTVLVGFLIVLGAWLIVYTISTALLKDEYVFTNIKMQ
ncbi:pilin [Candidatus Parcubacteria bacterium]|nr:pilin [Candidatus Parcubacteria bacterium]